MTNLSARSSSGGRMCLVYTLLRALAVGVPLGLLMVVGCEGTAQKIFALPGDLTLGGWVADYDTAQSQARATNRELLIFYKDTRLGVDDDSWRSLSSRELKRTLLPYVRCKLFRPYEPDRRFVAQYGVERAPALIIVHRDGTYHAQVGSMSTAQVAEFIARSAPPGSQPVLNPFIPRRVEHGWHRSFESAQAAIGHQPGRVGTAHHTQP